MSIQLMKLDDEGACWPMGGAGNSCLLLYWWQMELWRRGGREGVGVGRMERGNCLRKLLLPLASNKSMVNGY